MKKLFILLLFPLFIACSDDNNEELEPKQDYTSIIVEMDDYSLREIKLAYKKDGVFIKLADIGKLEFGESSKEVKISNSIREVYLFGNVGLFPRRSKDSFILNKSAKNTLLIGSKTSVFLEVQDSKDATQYPQN